MRASSRQPKSSSLVRLAVMSFLALLGVLVPAATPAAVAAPAAIAQDTFSRTNATGWGAADTGGSYSYDPGNGAFSTDGTAGVGTITLNKAQANRAAYLGATSARDVDVSVRVAFDKLPVGGGAWAYLPVRRNGSSEYRPKLIITATGSVTVQAGVVVNGSESAVGPAAETGLTPAAGTFLR